MSPHPANEGPSKGLKPCPCCGSLSIMDPGAGEICYKCCWTDTGAKEDQQEDENNGLTLSQARENFNSKGSIYNELK
ncbi:MAG: CPCC family cysteine-rich protein [Bacteroidota bacterium]